MTRPELADCGHALPDFPVFTEQHAYCGGYCREWMEPDCDPNCDGTGKDHGQHDCARAGEAGQCFAFCEECA